MLVYAVAPITRCGLVLAAATIQLTKRVWAIFMLAAVWLSRRPRGLYGSFLPPVPFSAGQSLSVPPAPQCMRRSHPILVGLISPPPPPSGGVVYKHRDVSASAGASTVLAECRKAVRQRSANPPNWVAARDRRHTAAPLASSPNASARPPPMRVAVDGRVGYYGGFQFPLHTSYAGDEPHVPFAPRGTRFLRVPARSHSPPPLRSIPPYPTFPPAHAASNPPPDPGYSTLPPFEDSMSACILVFFFAIAGSNAAQSRFFRLGPFITNLPSGRFFPQLERRKVNPILFNLAGWILGPLGRGSSLRPSTPLESDPLETALPMLYPEDFRRDWPQYIPLIEAQRT
ncbi:hypothetical protein GGX14DRAFT_570023 [Mycena pura]|uniref:Uncharacterized protein n=1 Tax=Mycena pura TaxID=153505 RepID=A0AAD6V9N2_9AGAR|nr:hypothetical protein GGX14DRAFT_570023 [Mycena pura]